MNKLTIDLELLERLACEVVPTTHQELLNASDDFGAAIKELRALLAAPRQPEGDGLEVVAWQDAENPLYTTAERRVLHDWVNNGYPIVELCRLSDHQRAIAELREVNRIQLEVATVHGAACVEIRKERDTLRQQLAERDAENERLRVKLMTIASAEPGRHNIEWAKAMAATGNNEAYAKWREAFDQRDKLAGLLREKFPRIDPENPYPLDEVEHCCEYTLYQERERLHREIDAALAEVKPCQESPNHAAT